MNQENMNQGVSTVPVPQAPVQPVQPQVQPQAPVQTQTPVVPVVQAPVQAPVTQPQPVQPQVQPQVKQTVQAPVPTAVQTPVQPQVVVPNQVQQAQQVQAPVQTPVVQAPVQTPVVQAPVQTPVTQPQPVQQNAMMTAAQAPVAQAPVLEPIPEIVEEKVQEPVPEIQESVVPSEPGEGDAEDITFDYNQLYGIQTEDIKVEESEEDKPVFTTQDIVLNENTIENRTNGDVTPVFNMNDLDDSSKSNSKLTDQVRDEEGQSKADSRRGIIFIAAIVIILIIFVKFIFPIINGYKF